jgi:hypothetical protein
LLFLVLATGVTACQSEDASRDRNERGTNAVDTCRGHGGVGAIEDDTVICTDQTTNDERGRRAVEACREHRGVAGFDDDIAVCRDQTFQAVAE